MQFKDLEWKDIVSDNVIAQRVMKCGMRTKISG